jgi:hypothetical protein
LTLLLHQLQHMRLPRPLPRLRLAVHASLCYRLVAGALI